MTKINKAILVMDYGDNPWLASDLVKYFEKVYYCDPAWDCGFTEVAACKLGSGFEGVEQIAYYANVIDEVDGIIFTDVEFDGIANMFKRDGRKVWGSGDVEELELDRGTFLESVKKAGLPVAKTEFIKGYDDLAKYLKGKEDVYVKLSHFRAIRETFHYINDKVSENVLAHIKTKVGCFKNEIEFYVQEPIESDFEWGFDVYCVKGILPKNIQFGFEKKNCLWFGKNMPISELDKSMQEVIEKYSKVLQDYEYTGFISLEVRRGKDGKEYPIDLTPRVSLPSGSTYINMGTNWGEVLKAGLDDELVELKVDAKYGVETLVNTSCITEYTALLFDEKYNDNIKPCVCAKREDIIWRLPNNQLYNPTDKLCFVTTKGDKLEDVISKNKEVCENITCEGSYYDFDAENFSKGILENLKKQTGIKF